MPRNRLIELQQEKERVFLVGVELPNRRQRGETLHELARLVRTAGGEVVGKLSQRKNRVDPTYYIGTGKAKELADICEEVKPDLVVFDNDLTAAQVRNLEKLIKVRVIDRSELILDIFVKHARTAQAKMQVELAQLEYELPRLKRMWTHLSRFEGGIGTRGPGEKQLEEDKRVIRNQITALKRKLKRIEKHREREVNARKAEYTVSLVGYTNAGKSTLMSRLTGTHVHIDDQLFATLDTKTALWELGGTKVLLSDSVGFIRDIPHHLIASFHATLAETVEADLLLHVVDASDPDAENMIGVVENVLAEIGCGSKPSILVLNKIDALKDPVELTILLRSVKSRCSPAQRVALSAKTGRGIDRLLEAVRKEAQSRWVTGTIELPAGKGKLLARLADVGEILSRSYEGNIVKIEVRLPVPDANKLAREPGVKVGWV